MTNTRIIRGDSLAVLRTLDDESVQCVVTSPPYWGLRDYGVAGQLGLEKTPEEYVARMVEVFGEVRRVLRDDGTCWVNMGDSYAQTTIRHRRDTAIADWSKRYGAIDNGRSTAVSGLKPKDLVGVPWRLAFALQADGWYLRSDIIWHKPNPMPESVRDRPTKAHEYVFLLSKSARYFYDQEAVREEQTGTISKEGSKPYVPAKMNGTVPGLDGSYNEQRMVTHRHHMEIPAGRNLRTVWTITPKPFKGAHFATFPPELAARCIKAGTSERGACPACGAAWERVTERTTVKPVDYNGKYSGEDPNFSGRRMLANTRARRLNGEPHDNPFPSAKTLGFRPSCDCHRPRNGEPCPDPVPCVVLDPFAGAGTVAMVAESLGRSSIGIELSPAYVAMARRRIKAARPSSLATVHHA